MINFTIHTKYRNKLFSAICLIFTVFSLQAQQFVSKNLSDPVIGKSNTILGYGYFNNDEHIDFIANHRENTINGRVALLISDGQNNSTPIYLDLNDRDISKIKAGDIDGDGNEDLVIYEHDSQEIVWFKSQYLKFQEKKVLSQGSATGLFSSNNTFRYKSRWICRPYI